MPSRPAGSPSRRRPTPPVRTRQARTLPDPLRLGRTRLGPYAPGQYGSTGQPGAGSWPGADPSAAAYPTATATMPGPNPAYAAGGYPPVRNRLTRSQDNRVIGGVLGGLARYWNTDPLLLRILTIVLTIATGGALLLGYIIAWIVIPLETSPPNGWPGTGTGYAAGGNPAYGSPGGDPPAARRPKRPRGRRAPTSAGSSCPSA